MRDSLVRDWFSGGMHAMLRNFVDAARGRLLVKAEELIERPRTLADLVGLFNRLGDVSLRQDHSFAELLAASKLRRDSR